MFLDEEPLIMQGSKGLNGISMPDCGLKKSDLKKGENAYINEKYIRKKPIRLPEVSEPTTVRHFTRLSSWNMCVDTVFYPLGSCTMKYNPKIVCYFLVYFRVIFHRAGAQRIENGIDAHIPA